MKAQTILVHTVSLFSFLALAALILFLSVSVLEFSAFNNFVVVPTLIIFSAAFVSYINEKMTDKFIA